MRKYLFKLKSLHTVLNLRYKTLSNLYHAITELF
jgi:hypothetical protein